MLVYFSSLNKDILYVNGLFSISLLFYECGTWLEWYKCICICIQQSWVGVITLNDTPKKWQVWITCNNNYIFTGSFYLI